MLVMSEAQPIVTRLADAIRQAADLVVLLDGLLSAAPVGFACWDNSLRCVHANAFLEGIAAVSAAGILGATLGQVLPGMAAQLEPLCQTALTSAGREPAYGE